MKAFGRLIEFVVFAFLLLHAVMLMSKDEYLEANNSLLLALFIFIDLKEK